MVEYQYIVADDFATGEGRTISILITRAYPKHDLDYDLTIPHGFIDGKFVMPTLKEGHTPKLIAAREFVEEFGGYTAQLAENLTKEVFLKRYENYLPIVTKNMVSDEMCEDGHGPGNFKFKQQVHFNFS